MKIIDNKLLDAITAQAKENPRLRMNFNFHDSLNAPAQRLLNALEPGTEVPTHRHRHTAETYVLLRGELEIILYNDRKEITETVILNPENGVFGAHIPIGQWHAVKVRTADTVIFEVKDGPYAPLDAEDILIV